MITMKTPHPEMYKTFWKEYDKCEYWIERHQSKKIFRDELEKKEGISINGSDLPILEYNPPSGNKWKIIRRLYMAANLTGIQYDSICCWDCVGSIGAFVPMIYENKKYIFITTSHFWQRVCERLKMEFGGIRTIETFFRNNSASKLKINELKEDEQKRRVSVHFNKGAAFGVLLNEEYGIIELRTYLSNAHLTGNKKREHKKVTDKMLSDNLRDAIVRVGRMMERDPQLSLEEAIVFLSPTERDTVLEEFEKFTKELGL